VLQTAARSVATTTGRELATRRWAAAGVALAATSMIAVPAVSPGISAEISRDAQAAQAAAVRLTAGFNPLAAYVDTFNTASANASTLANNFFLAPFVGMQQAIVNQFGYVQELLNDPANFQTVLGQIATNVNKVATGLPLINADADTITAVTAHTLDGLHNLLLTQLPSFLPAGTDPTLVVAVANFLSSPISGVLMGAIGPVVSPGVALLNSALAIATAVEDGDATTALSDLLSVPANVANGFLNGATLNLDALTPFINNSGVLGSTTLSALNVAFGGLLSVGSVGQGTYNPGGGADPITTPGGSILNSIGLTVNTEVAGTPITLAIPGQAVGPIGALEAVSQTIGVLLGDNWDGKNGAPVPPLSGLKFPTIPTAPTTTTDSAAAPTVAAAIRTTAADATVADSVAAADTPSTTVTKTTKSTKALAAAVESAADDSATAAPVSTVADAPAKSKNNKTSDDSGSSSSGSHHAGSGSKKSGSKSAKN
jgi:hypothetical protein